MATTTTFGLREMAIDALAKQRHLVAVQQQQMNEQQRRDLVSTLRMRMLRLFNIDGVPLTEDEERFFTPEWFSLDLLEPGVVLHETSFSHINQFVPVCIIEGVMIAPNYNHLVVGTWNENGPPTDVMPINGLADLGYWCEQRREEDTIDAVTT
jgi:hypothetical protein